VAEGRVESSPHDVVEDVQSRGDVGGYGRTVRIRFVTSSGIVRIGLNGKTVSRAFASICSDLSHYPVSHADTASSACPVIHVIPASLQWGGAFCTLRRASAGR
jgi:hypothetical protein